MNLKASAVAVALALAGTGAWAGDTEPDEKADAAAATSVPSQDAPAEAVSGWQFENGESTGGSQQIAGPQSEDPDSEAKTSLGYTEGDQASQSGESAAMSDEQSEQYQAERPDTTQGQDPAASTAEQTPGNSPQSPREPEAAQYGDDSSAGTAMSEQEESESSAQTGMQDQEEQSADSGMPAHLQGKVIVIIPKDWQGSMQGLLTALQSAPDAQDIVIVQQGEPGETDEPQASGTQIPDDTYEASRPLPQSNQQ